MSRHIPVQMARKVRERANDCCEYCRLSQEWQESVQEFRLYQQELNRFIAETQPALEQSARGESRPLDVDALMQRVRNRLTKSES